MVCIRVNIDLIKPSTEAWVLPSDTPRPYRQGVVPGTVDMDAFVNDLKKSDAVCRKAAGPVALSVLASLVATAAAATMTVYS